MSAPRVWRLLSGTRQKRYRKLRQPAAAAAFAELPDRKHQEPWMFGGCLSGVLIAEFLSLVFFILLPDYTL